MNFMLISCPKQGTDFLMKGLLVNKRLRYQREFFNPITNSIPSVVASCGSHVETYNVASDDQFNDAISEFKHSGLNCTKENYLTFRVPLLVQDFTLTALHRKRIHTFPSTKPEFIEAILISFLQRNYSDKWLTEIQLYLKAVTRCKEVYAHTLNWYIMFRYCNTYGIPVIEYDKILTLNANRLNVYLKNRLPEFVYKDSISKRLINIRKENIATTRQIDYLDLNCEVDVHKFLDFLETGPDYPYTYNDLLRECGESLVSSAH